jgi:hypothetical protein
VPWNEFRVRLRITSLEARDSDHPERLGPDRYSSMYGAPPPQRVLDLLPELPLEG